MNPVRATVDLRLSVQQCQVASDGDARWKLALSLEATGKMLRGVTYWSSRRDVFFLSFSFYYWKIKLIFTQAK